MPPSGSNQTLTIYGDDFRSGCELEIRDPAGNSYWSASKFTYHNSGRVSYRINNDNDSGQWRVKVINPDGKDSSWEYFTVSEPSHPAPSISSVSPNPMPPSGSNQTLTIYGSDFHADCELEIRDPGGTRYWDSSKFTYHDPGRVSYRINNDNDSGQWRVKVINPGDRDSNWAYFTVAVPSPKISRIVEAPIKALTVLQTITIEGSGFVEKPTLSFLAPDGKTYPSYSTRLTYDSTTRLTYRIKTEGDHGTWKVTLKNPDGTESNTFSFRVEKVGGTAPKTPSGLTASLGSGGVVSLSWTDNAGDESGFKVQRKKGSSGAWSQIGTTAANKATYSDAGVSAGNSYTYRVYAYNGAGDSQASNLASVTYPTAGQVGISISAPGTGDTWYAGDSRTIRWSPTGSSHLVSYYRVYHSLNGGTGYSEVSPATAITGTSRAWNIPSNFESSRARIKVAAFDATGKQIAVTESGLFSITIPNLKPTAKPDASNSGPKVGQQVSFYGSNSTAPSGRTISSYSWNLGDGSTQSGATVTHSYQKIGTYTATLTVTDSAGQTNSRNLTITVTGNAVGKENDSAMFADPVNLATGNFVLEAEDISMPGLGFALAFQRFYNSKEAAGDGKPLGHNWTHNYNSTLSEADELVLISFEDGRIETYQANGDGTYAPEDGVFSLLTKNSDGSFTLRGKDHLYRHYTGGRLTRMSDRNNNTQTLQYDTAGKLIKVLDESGRYLNFAYNADGRIETITDPLGRTLRYTYDSSGNLVTATDPRGGVTRYGYDSLHQMTTATDPNGNDFVTNDYDAQQRVVSVQKDAYGARTEFAYDFTTRLTTVIDTFGNKTYHQHDDKLRLVSETNERGHTESYAYDNDNNRTMVVDRNGNATRYTYDSQGNVTSKTDPMSHRTTITYNSFNDPLVRTDALGNSTRFSYGPMGNLTGITDALGRQTKLTVDNDTGKVLKETDRLGNTTSHEYDPAGNRIKTTDALAGVSRLTYDATGRVLTVTNQLGQSVTTTYDGNDNILTITDPLSRKTTYEYDANDNKTKVIDPENNATSYTYDAKDRLIKTTDALTNSVSHEYDAYDRKTKTIDQLGKETTFEYDGAGNLTAVVSPLGGRTGYGYDPVGNRTSITDPMGRKTEVQYDMLNRPVSTTDPLGHKSQVEYDALGRKIKATDALGRITRFAYDALGRLIQVTDPAGGVTKHIYDAEGRKTATTLPKGQTVNITYDKLGRLESRREPGGNTTRYTYDAAGNRKSRTDAKGATTQYTYDAAGQLKQTTYPDSSTVVFTYDDAGRQTGMIDANGTTSYTYDELGRMTAYSSPHGWQLTYGYDKASRRTSIAYPGSRTVTYGYDDDGRMTSVTDWMTRATTYSYDAAGGLLETLNPNGTKCVQTYDAAGRLASLANYGPANAVINSYQYSLDAVGNHRSVTTVEPLEPTIPEEQESYTYDTEDRMLTKGTVRNEFDNNGNMTAIGNTVAMTYDYENRLVKVRAREEGYDRSRKYDGMGRMLSLSVYTAEQKLLTDVAMNLPHIVASTDWNSDLDQFYVYGLGLVSKIDVSGDAEYYHFDSRGSTIAITDSSGSVVRSFAYDPFGDSIGQSDANASDKFLYLGKHGVLQDFSGFYYVRARHYSTLRGRFLQKDPFLGHDDQPQTLHRYVYALNNPVRLIDVSGFSARETASRSIEHLTEDAFKHLILRYIQLNADIFGPQQVAYLTNNIDVTLSVGVKPTLEAAKSYVLDDVDLLVVLEDYSWNIAAGALATAANKVAPVMGGIIVEESMYHAVHLKDVAGDYIGNFLYDNLGWWNPEK